MLSKFKNISLAMMVLALCATSAFAGTPGAELMKKLAMADLNHQFVQAVQGKVEQLAASRQFKQRIVNYSPEKKIVAFLRAVEEAKAKSIDTAKFLKTQSEKTSELSSSISGTVALRGAEIFAFGSHGFFAGYAKADATGKFSIRGLMPGEYFLYTKNGKSDAYKSVNAPVRADKFSDALSLVSSDLKTVALNLATSQEDDATISGIVTDADTATPLTLALIFAYATDDTSFETLAVSFLGSYELVDLEPGSYILYADSYFEFTLDLLGTAVPLNARLGQYYQGASTPAEATVLTVAANEELTEKNFILEMGGAISGTIKDETGAALDSVFVIAVKDIELSLDNFSGYFMESIDLAVTVADASGNYVAPGLKTGEYIVGTFSLLNSNFSQVFADESVFLGKHAGRVLDEYYGGVQSIFDIGDATRVSVTESSTTENINFDLELAGSISGSFTDASTGGAVLGTGTAIVFDEESGLPQLAFTAFDSATGTYSVQPLRTGSYKMLGIVAPEAESGDSGEGKPFYEKNLINLVQQEDVLYLPQFYDGKATYDEADAVAVTQPTPTPDVNFNMRRTATIAGVVNLPASGIQLPDSIEVAVIAFDNQTGKLAGSSTAFAGEPFSFSLPAGTYKIAAKSFFPGLGVAYAGGGTSFNDANSMQFTVDFGQVVDGLVITLTPEFGIISGTVIDDFFEDSLPGVFVLAYDGTGHAVGAGITGLNNLTGELLENPGDYAIGGLASGNYFVRTFSLFKFLQLLGEGFSDDEDADPLTLIFGLLDGGDDNPLSDVDLALYEDAWYDGENIAPNLDDTDIFSAILNLFLSQSDPGALIPFFSTPPSGAVTVAVSSPGETENINFRLSELDLNLTSVEESAGQLPADFALEQNYPNPFNPTTVISYKVPVAGQVSLQIYNVLGQKIKTLFDGEKSAGTFNLQWNGLNEKGQQVAAGIYVVRLESENAVLSRKMLLIK